MKKFIPFLLCLTLLLCTNSNSFAYGGLRKQNDYRYTTQRDRNARVETYQKFLKSTGIFEEDHHKYKELFNDFKEDKNNRINLKHLKFDEPLPTQDYIVKGNYYLMADKILANYSVTYNDNPTFEYIYDMFGNLFQVKILYGDENQRPYHKAIYSNNGYLQKISFYATDGFEYIFLADGDLQGVVVNGKLYNRVGRPTQIWLL